MIAAIASTAVSAPHKMLFLKTFILSSLFFDLHPAVLASYQRMDKLSQWSAFWSFQTRCEVVRLNLFRSGVSKR
jgi:hypothetical protein